jgi:hypothetical protein
MALASPWSATQATEIALLETPVKVTATLNVRDEGGYAAQIGVHTGPIAQLVSTTVIAGTQTEAERVLRKQVQWQAPYLFVHSSCGAGRNLRCEGETVFKIVESSATRLGDVIGMAPAVYAQGRFLDVYDKLEGQLDPAQALTPRFVIVLDDAGRQLAANAAATWSANSTAWQEHAARLTTTSRQQLAEAELSKYLSALISNAALARYCNRNDELQQLLNSAHSVLTVGQLRMMTDTLSKVVPLEAPRAWRKPY